MSADEQTPTTIPTTADTAATPAEDALVEQERSEKILKAKELYSHGSRNFLVKSYAEAADELSEVCALYEELYGELSDELGMPYLLYAKSLIALALDENKVIDVPDVEDDDDDDDDDDEEEDVEDEAMEETVANGKAAASTSQSANSSSAKLDAIKRVAAAELATKSDEAVSSTAVEKTDETLSSSQTEEQKEEAQVSSSNDDGARKSAAPTNGKAAAAGSVAAAAAVVTDGEKPSTSNGEAGENGAEDDEEEENEAASSLQLAWEILELAAKIFSRQGMGGLPNLAEVQTELANIEFENNILDSARDDYEKALKIYQELPTNYRRAMAEIHYKIGLTYLMQQLNKEGATSLKEACQLIEEEIGEINAKSDINEKDKNNVQDMEETKQEIWAKIAEIEETQAQNVAEVRAALDSYIKPISSQSADSGVASSSSSSSAAAGSSSTKANAASSSKPTDISHLIKRKKPEEPSSEAEAASASPAKRPAL